MEETNRQLRKEIEELKSTIETGRRLNRDLIKQLLEAKEHNQELDRLLHMLVNKREEAL